MPIDRKRVHDLAAAAPPLADRPIQSGQPWSDSCIAALQFLGLETIETMEVERSSLEKTLRDFVCRCQELKQAPASAPGDGEERLRPTVQTYGLQHALLVLAAKVRNHPVFYDPRPEWPRGMHLDASGATTWGRKPDPRVEEIKAMFLDAIADVEVWADLDKSA